MTKILCVGNSLEGGGSERSFGLLAAALEGKDLNVVVFLTGAPPHSESVGTSDGVVTILPPGWSRGFRVKTLRRGAALVSLRRAIRREKPDYIFSFLPGPSFLSLVASKFLGARVVVFERTFPPLALEPRWVDFFRRLLYPGSDALVMQTDLGRQWAERQFPGLRVLSIPNGVVVPVPPTSAPRVKPAARVSSSAFVLLAVGRLVAEKRFDLLIEAFAKIEDSCPDWVLVILGGGPMEPQLREKISTGGLSERVHLIGPVGNVQEWYERASMICSVSAVEGYPNALLEGLANGLPALAVDCPTGPREILDGGRRGILLPFESSSSDIAEAILSVIGNLRSPASYSSLAREVVELNSPAKVADMVIDQVMQGSTAES